MLMGAACWGASGTDLWQALAGQTMNAYLNSLESVKPMLAASTFFWTLGVLLLGTAGTMMSAMCTKRPGLVQLQKTLLGTAVPVAVVSFFMMFSLTVSATDIHSANLIGWTGARLDDLATAMIIGFSPMLLSVAGKKDWVPGWLGTWGMLAGLAGALDIACMFTGLTALSFIIIPIGMGWMIAAGVVLIRRAHSVF